MKQTLAAWLAQEEKHHRLTHEALKLRLLQSRATQAKADIAAGNLVDGGAFFNDLEAGHHD